MIGKGSRPELKRAKPRGPNDKQFRDPEQIKISARAILESVGLTSAKVRETRWLVEGYNPGASGRPLE